MNKICHSLGKENGGLSARRVRFRNWHSLEECGFIKASDEANAHFAVGKVEGSSKLPEHLWITSCSFENKEKHFFDFFSHI